jgi:hypothetical protein
LKKKDLSQRKCRECVEKGGDDKATVLPPPPPSSSNESSGDVGNETRVKHPNQVAHDKKSSMNSDKKISAARTASSDRKEIQKSIFDMVYDEEFHKRRGECQRRKEQGLVCNHHGMTIAERINEKSNTLWTLLDKFSTTEGNGTMRMWKNCISI